MVLSCPRLSASRELDRNVKGYKELRKDLAQVTPPQITLC
jgi:hypothetical protein